MTNAMLLYSTTSDLFSFSSELPQTGKVYLALPSGSADDGRRRDARPFRGKLKRYR